MSPERLMKFGAQLQRFPLAWSVGALGLRAMSQPRRARQIDDYLTSNPVRRLRFGSGRHTDEGWLSADLIPLAPNVVYMDARKPLPLPSDSFDFIVCEHMIEHVDLSSARRLLGEFARVLRRGGVLRIATPDLGRLIRFVTRDEATNDDAAVYVRTMNAGIGGVPDDDIDNAAYMINRVVRDWGHTFLFDEETLTGLLRRAGFTRIERGVPGESDHPDLNAVERHHEEIGERINRIETLLLEALVSK